MIWAYSEAIGRRLLAWAVVSVSAGLFLLLAGDAFWRGFGVQAAAWGVGDGVIAGFGLRAAHKRARAPEAEARFLRRLLWINAGLDVGYIAAGLALAFTLGAADAGWRGHGWGVAAQGAFLLLFDFYHAARVPPEPSLPPRAFFGEPEHQPFWMTSGSRRNAALLVHGFPGTPAEMRAVGAALHGAGWTARGLRLPGFGSEIPTLIYRRYPEWTRAVAEALDELRRDHARVLLVGYSFGAALCVEVAAGAKPDGLILLAPFVWAEPAWARAAVALARPFLPHAFRPYARADFADPRFRRGMTRFMPDVDWDDPQAQQAVRDFKVPVTLLAEVRQTRRALRLAPQVRAPALVVQGAQDPVSRPALTTQLVRRLGGPVRYEVVDAGHDLIERSSPAWPEVERLALAFAAEMAAR